MVPELLLLKHFKYLDAASDYVDGTNDDPPQVMDANECEVAVWLRDNPNDELNEVHAEFHRVIEDAVKLKQDGHDEDARSRMDEAYLLLARVEKILLAI